MEAAADSAADMAEFPAKDRLREVKADLCKDVRFISRADIPCELLLIPCLLLLRENTELSSDWDRRLVL